MALSKCLLVAAAVSAGMTASMNADAITLKLAHQWPQAESDYVIATAIKFAQEVEKKSNGDIKIQFFPAESLVKASNTHTALKNGTVDLSIYPYIYAAGAIPEMNLVLMPGIWKSHDDVFRFRNTEPWKKIEAKAEAYGFKTLCWIQISGGVASTGKPIDSDADVAGEKVRAAGKYMSYALQQAKASTVSMPSSENYNAMQMGLLDAVWTSSSSFGAYRLYEVSKYYVSPEKYSIYYTIDPIAISMKTWKKLTPEQQQILAEVGKSLEESALEGARKEDSRVAALFASHGVKVSQMSLESWNKWHALFEQHAFPKFKKDNPSSADLLDEMLALYK
ncbi:C4-dicarboxylate ABC transporter substrate-binding protein [Allopusillimonas soli]|uniref:TRAP transporter substrate-binding protein DctP n=1 Tax=Allopusillimonas soli TaxID=659016 RepID=A0A853F8B9_9BURK|nr:TRAP transporter substrate-binding protein DctP [Allopusillimonas soli]NYT36875.1 TRAP transporter substrate-binding protein DctP [Allopusillimonas soli]TEA75334.1 C4-dicarboxylate ABC transporter substrate-binding protein [Allopusillimonas soli]